MAKLLQVLTKTSIIRFIEDNWGLGRIGNQSFDSKAGPIINMFDFSTSANSTVTTIGDTNNLHNNNAPKLFLHPNTGTVIQ